MHDTGGTFDVICTRNDQLSSPLTIHNVGYRITACCAGRPTSSGHHRSASRSRADHGAAFMLTSSVRASALCDERLRRELSCDLVVLYTCTTHELLDHQVPSTAI
jgi:hypothetical protein